MDEALITRIRQHLNAALVMDKQGEILEHDSMAQDKRLAEAEAGRPRRETA